MGRTHVSPIVQKYEEDCGPASLKHALAILGKRRSLSTLYEICKTTRNGTSTRNMVRAIGKLGYAALVMQHTSLRHLISALKYSPNAPRAVLVSYLYTSVSEDSDWKESGHWAAVSTYSASLGRIVLFDSYTGRKKSYTWSTFKNLWKDYDLVRSKKISKNPGTLSKKWQYRLMIVIAKNGSELPKFTQRGVRYVPSHAN